MIPIDYLLAVALLTAYDDGSYEPLYHLDSVRPTTQAVAVYWEILDSRETKYVLNRVEDYAGDLRLLRRRYLEVADAPPISDGMRFPTRELISAMLSFNRKYRTNLEHLVTLELVYKFELRTVIKETDELYQIWNTLRDAQCEYYYISVRRKALKSLRHLVGAEAYYSGVLPPYVPIWRFSSID